MEWIQAKIFTTNEGIDSVCAMLLDAGVANVQIEDDLDMINFLNSTRGQWDYVEDGLMNKEIEETRVTFYLTSNEFGHETLILVNNGIERLKNIENDFIKLGRLSLELLNVDDETWINEWKKYYKPFLVSKNIVIKPEWELYDKKDNEIVLIINPGHVFGTGLHQTTKLCICALEKHMNGEENVLDLGCGTGILSIASLLLHANFAFAVDIDPNAVKIVQENAQFNNIDQLKFTVASGNILDDDTLISQIQLIKYDLVVANIVADVIIQVTPTAHECLNSKGIFVTSGIIGERTEEVYVALAANNFEVLETTQQDDWFCIVSQKK